VGEGRIPAVRRGISRRRSGRRRDDLVGCNSLPPTGGGCKDQRVCWASALRRRRCRSGDVAPPRVSAKKKLLRAAGGEQDLVRGAAGGQHVDALGTDDDLHLSD